MELSFEIDDLNARIEAEIPCLRRYAHTLTRDRVAADDLVQDCIVRALSNIHLWQRGTNFHAWLFAIMRNEYVDGVRRATRGGTPPLARETEPLFKRAAEQDKRLEVRDLNRALRRLSEEQRIAVLLAGLDGLSYKTVADLAGVPLGTIRARISRARAALRRLTGAEGGIDPL